MLNDGESNYAEDKLQQILIKYQDIWDYMEDIFVARKKSLVEKEVGSQSRGDDGWPSTAAHSP